MTDLAEGTSGSIGNQPWAQRPESRTYTGPDYQPDEATAAFLRGDNGPKSRDEWADQMAQARTLCRGPEDCGHPEWHRLAE